MPEPIPGEPKPIPVTAEIIDSWADSRTGPVALHMKQKLVPVEGEGGVIFPPTYADIGYSIDTLSDGTKVALIDSVGSQANRMEPLFKRPPLAAFVPQIEIELHAKDDNGDKYIEKRSLLDLAHRSADAVVYSCPTLAPTVEKAFRALKRGDAGPLCRLAPTSLVFGVWDSRGTSGEKRPRLVRSIIRAWDVQELHAAAQFDSIWKSLSPEQQAKLEKEAKAKKTKLSEKGFADAPATFRKVSQTAAKHMHEFKDGSPNSVRRVLGGVLVAAGIQREITVILVALRGLQGSKQEESESLRRYLLSLALIAATADTSMFLCEGCNLRYESNSDNIWSVVPLRGEHTRVEITCDLVRSTLLPYATKYADRFRPNWPTLTYKFDLKEAKKLLAKKDEDEQSET